MWRWQEVTFKVFQVVTSKHKDGKEAKTKTEDGKLDYSIAKAKDNHKYLTHAADGTANLLGAIFLDYRNESLEDPFVLVYGHDTDNGTMFGPLRTNKAEQLGAEFTFFGAANTKFKTKAVLVAIIPGETLINPKDYADFNKREQFYAWLQPQAIKTANYALQPEDKLVCLITCTYERQNARLLIVTVY